MKKGAYVEFFAGACKAEHIVCEKDVKKLGARLRISTDDGSRGKKCYVTDLLAEFLERATSDERRATSDERRATNFACGPRPMLAAVSRIAARDDLRAQVSVDAYMACGIGACLGCAIRTTEGYKMVCEDGPVFDSREIVWEEAV
jgi:dihydroorotate dehydrogenase electron transfer subunit